MYLFHRGSGRFEYFLFFVLAFPCFLPSTVSKILCVLYLFNVVFILGVFPPLRVFFVPYLPSGIVESQSKGSWLLAGG